MEKYEVTAVFLVSAEDKDEAIDTLEELLERGKSPDTFYIKSAKKSKEE